MQKYYYAEYRFTTNESCEVVGHGGLWARTEVIGGYGEVNINPLGKSTIGETLFRDHNIVPIGGVSYVMEQMFGINENQIYVPSMYEVNGIGLPNSTPPAEVYQSPTGDKSVIYRYIL